MVGTPARLSSAAAPAGPSRLRGQLEAFRDRLLKTDFRNPSVRMRRPNTPRSYDLALSEAADTGVGERILRAAVLGKGREGLVRSGDLSPEAVARRKVLYQLSRTVRIVRDETGVEDLFVGFPFLVGHLSDGHHVRGPLLLFPASLEKRANDPQPGWFVNLESGRDPVPNRALLEVIRKKMDIDLTEKLDELLQGVIDEPPATGVAVGPLLRQRLGPLLVQAGLVAEYRPEENILSRLAPLARLAGPSYTEGPREPLVVEPALALGRFPQGSTSIHEDYLTLLAGDELPTELGAVLPLLQAEALEGQGAGRSAPPPAPPAGREESLRLVLESDTSQDETIRASRRVPALVTQGPPGTGKSQLIVNLIGNALARGEHVLVVCQKRAALDVVQQRLQRVGLDRFAALVQDASGDRKGLYRKLAAQIAAATDRPPRPDPTPELLRTEAELAGAAASLESWALTLREVRYGSLTLPALYVGSDPAYRAAPATVEAARALQLDDLDALASRLPPLEEGYARFDAPGAPYQGERPFQRQVVSDPAGALGALEAIDARSAASPLYTLENQGSQAAALGLLTTYADLEGRAAKWLRPAWWRSRAEVRALSHRFNEGADGLARLHQGLRAGADLLSAVSGSGPWMTAPYLQKLQQQALVDRRRLVSQIAWLKLAVGEWPAVLAYDDQVSALPGAQRKFYQTAQPLLFGRPGPLRDLLRKEALSGWVQLYERGTPFQTSDVFATYLATRERFAALLEKQRKLTVDLISYHGDGRLRPPPIVASSGRAKRPPPTAQEMLLRELSKKSRTRPLRELVRTYGKVLLDVAPCWLVSPEAASDVFPLLPGFFDLVVFDEASQLAVERALPAVIRGKRCLVGGDEQQLPPFDLFELGDGDEEEEGSAPDGEDADEALRAESLLDLALLAFPKTRLTWHYRSQWQELIDFSNHVFYDWALHVSPNSVRAPAIPPIRYLQVDGKWERNSNLLEAEKVVDVLAETLASKNPTGEPPSVGVVTFNHPQRRLIEERIEERRAKVPSFNTVLSKVESAEELDRRPFVKNIEQVQGDERDVVIFSVGYAPGPNGKVAVRFGPVNEVGGEKRLNVAITRARHAMVVVASFSTSQLDASGSKNPGPKLMEGFLQYAEAVSARDLERQRGLFAKYGGLGGEAERLPLETPLGPSLEVQLQQALKERGLSSDLFVGRGHYKLGLGVVDPKDPTRYVLGIETDGPMYASGRSATERDVVRQRFLEKAGWTVERVWSQRWYKDRGSEIDRIVARVKALTGTAR